MSLASLLVKRQLMAATVELRSATLAFTGFAKSSAAALRPRGQAQASTVKYLSSTCSQLPCPVV